MRTAQRFTGQQSDGSGLIYMNARYYDPQLGLFISPDSLVPDATNLYDYNRYMYSRGNPMKYNDPSGHCPAPDKPGGTAEENRAASAANAKCTALTDTILNVWDKTDYWRNIWPDKQAFQKYVADDPNLDYNFFFSYWKAYQPYEKHWETAQRKVEAAERKSQDGDLFHKSPLCDTRTTDCNVVLLDGASILGGAIQISSPACLAAAPACFTLGTGIGAIGTVGGALYTLNNRLRNPASVSNGDLAVTAVTTLIGLAPGLDYRIQIVASLEQTIYDFYPDNH